MPKWEIVPPINWNRPRDGGSNTVTFIETTDTGERYNHSITLPVGSNKNQFYAALKVRVLAARTARIDLLDMIGKFYSSELEDFINKK